MPANLFSDIPATLPEELVEILCHTEHIRIERIVSRGHTSPMVFWYDQEWNEFILLVSGRARLAFANARLPIDMAAGDWLVIPAHERHRVEWTDPNLETVWLAVHNI